jgi:hypothetical protein
MKFICNTDVWGFYGMIPPIWLCITTNGDVNKSGLAIMGRGVALEAQLRFPSLPKRLGDALLLSGNRPFVFAQERLITFPVKWHWSEPADLNLIERSANWLARVISEKPEILKGQQIYLPAPGTGNGRRTWSQVRPWLHALEGINQVTIITRKERW